MVNWDVHDHRVRVTCIGPLFHIAEDGLPIGNLCLDDSIDNLKRSRFEPLIDREDQEDIRMSRF
jgi:hypothetical protein